MLTFKAPALKPTTLRTGFNTHILEGHIFVSQCWNKRWCHHGRNGSLDKMGILQRRKAFDCNLGSIVRVCEYNDSQIAGGAKEETCYPRVSFSIMFSMKAIGARWAQHFLMTITCYITDNIFTVHSSTPLPILPTISQSNAAPAGVSCGHCFLRINCRHLLRSVYRWLCWFRKMKVWFGEEKCLEWEVNERCG